MHIRSTMLSLALSLGVSLVAIPDEAAAYATTAAMRPTGLTISLVLKAEPLHNNFTRYLTFTNRAGTTKAVALDFVKTSTLHYTGTITAAGLVTLQSLAEQNNRSYWDQMKFENKGGTTPLDIASIHVDIEYDDTCCGREPTAQIAYQLNNYLAAGNDSFSLPGIGGSGRINYAQDQLGISYNTLMSYPLPFRYMVYDIGKAGSSDTTDAAAGETNPKFGLSGSALCSETISWYFHEYGVRLVDVLFPQFTYDFRDTTSHAVMHDQFLAAGRLYCYHPGQVAWVKKDFAYNWVIGTTITPKAGDYLDRRDSDGNPSNGDDGHAMMIAKWNAATGVATTLDGPWNINFRDVAVKALENAGTNDFCVGRIPAND
jgi:hypothetical protein